MCLHGKFVYLATNGQRTLQGQNVSTVNEHFRFLIEMFHLTNTFTLTNTQDLTNA